MERWRDDPLVPNSTRAWTYVEEMTASLALINSLQIVATVHDDPRQESKYETWYCTYVLHSS